MVAAPNLWNKFMELITWVDRQVDSFIKNPFQPEGWITDYTKHLLNTRYKRIKKN